MDIVIAGGHGQIAMLLHPLLRQRGHRVRGLIRNPEHAGDLEAAGAEPIICDLETTDDLAGAVAGADAVIFAAGAGPGSGAARKRTVDRDGAIKLIEAARHNHITRYLMISAIDVEKPRGGEVFQAYCRAKAEADAALRQSGLDYTIIRPGRLTDEPATGRIALAPSLRRSDIPRADVAATLAAVLDNPAMAGLQLDLVSGDQPIQEALRRVVA